ncbi:Target of Myb protein 1, partial [Galemys pyrenaicus]
VLGSEMRQSAHLVEQDKSQFRIYQLILVLLSLTGKKVSLWDPTHLCDCGVFSSEKATDGSLQSEDWALNMEICDIINETEEG